MSQHSHSAMEKRSFLSFIAKRFGGKKRQTNDKSDFPTVTTSENVSRSIPVTEMVVVTELSRGLGRTIPYYNDDNFAGIVTFHKLPSSRNSSVHRNASHGKFEDSGNYFSRTRQQRNQGKEKFGWNQPKQVPGGKQISNSLDKKYQGIYNLDEPTRSLLIADICKPMTNWDLYVYRKN